VCIGLLSLAWGEAHPLDYIIVILLLESIEQPFHPIQHGITLGLPFLSRLDAAAATSFSIMPGHRCRLLLTVGEPTTHLSSSTGAAGASSLVIRLSLAVASLLPPASSVVFDPCRRLRCTAVPPDPTRVASTSSASSTAGRHQPRARRVRIVVVCPSVTASPTPVGRHVCRLAQIRLKHCQTPPSSTSPARLLSSASLDPPPLLGPNCSLVSLCRVLLLLLRLGLVPESSPPAAQACSSQPRFGRIALPQPRSSLCRPRFGPI
jgi:hypothetical protein